MRLIGAGVTLGAFTLNRENARVLYPIVVAITPRVNKLNFEAPILESPDQIHAVLRVLGYTAACLAIACLGIALTFVSSALRSPLFGLSNKNTGAIKSAGIAQATRSHRHEPPTSGSTTGIVKSGGKNAPIIMPLV